jgi:hypothetical protein
MNHLYKLAKPYLSNYSINTVNGTIFATVNEGSSITLTAPDNTIFTAVLFASFGRPTGSNGNYAISSCHSSTSFNVVSNYVIGVNTVTIPVNTTTFGDPCSGQLKWLSVLLQYSTPTNLRRYLPSNLDGLAIWFDASDYSTLTFSSGSFVSAWSSKSTPTNITVSQSNTNLQPQIVNNILNNLPVLRTTNPGSSTYVNLFNNAVPWIDIATTTSVAIFIVHNPTMNNATSFAYQDPTGNKRILLHTPITNDIIWDWNNGTNINRLQYSMGTNGGTNYRAEGFKVECVYVSNGVQGYRKNGTLLSSMSATTAGFNTTQVLCIGAADPTTTTYYYRQDIAEIVWYRTALNSTDIQRIEGYLAWKWGLQGKLPSNHLFKNNAPTI